MVAAVLPAHRNCICGKAPAAYGLEIFHGQGVVGLGQEPAASGLPLQYPLPGGGVGKPPVHFCPDGPVYILPQQDLRRRPQGVYVPALAAETEGFHAAAREQAHTAVGKFFRRGHGPRGGQLRHQVGSASDGHLRPDEFFRAGRAASLGEVATHGAHHRLPRRTGPAQQRLMSPVQGVKFTYNAHCVHGRPSFACLFSFHFTLFFCFGQRPVAIRHKKRYNTIKFATERSFPP